LPDVLVQCDAARCVEFGRPRGSFSGGETRLADHPARLFVCARCHAQVLLCSRCDRGQRYCGRVCSRAARSESRRDAAERYQRSRAGRIAHAARSRRWRQRQREVARIACSGDVVDSAVINFVTHQGSPITALDAPLPLNEQAAEVCVVAKPTPIAPARCRRCAAALSPWARLGFLRHARGMRWPVRVVEPCP
jgi:hypothetical protein